MAGTPTARQRLKDLRNELLKAGIDPETLERSAQLRDEGVLWDVAGLSLGGGATREEIASLLRLNGDLDDKVMERFGLSFQQWSDREGARVRALVRSSQVKLAVEKLDRGLLIWLGKMLLGQKEDVRHDTSPIQVIVMPKEDGSLSFQDTQGKSIGEPVVLPHPKKK
jgi:hypothetical protein